MKLFFNSIILMLGTMTLAYSQNVKITYTLGMSMPSTHMLELELRYEGLPSTDNQIEVKLPVWRPGRYLIFDFAGGVQEFSASAGDAGLRWTKTDKSTWRIEKGENESVSVSYKVYANEFGLRTRGLNDEHAFIDGSSVFMYAEKYRALPVLVKVVPYGGWKVTTGLEKIEGESLLFKAGNFDDLVDSPLEVGNQKDFEFDVEGKKHLISFFGECSYDIEKIKTDVSAVISENYRFWGKVPYDNYVFIVHCAPGFGGGTEHLNSTILGIRPEFLDKESGYLAFLRLVSHEFFHTWNVKQFKPSGLTPYDYSKENYTSELWIAEGGTSYYDGLILLRTGHYTAKDFIDELVKAVEEDRRRPGNKVQSLAESSFDAWIKFWKQLPQSYNMFSDYYSKGSYVFIILDLFIRNSSNGRYSLDDVMRTMFESFPRDVKGYTNEDFRKVCEEYSGSDLSGFFNDYVFGVKPIDWEKYLGMAGLDLRSEDSSVVPQVGLRTYNSGKRIMVGDVISGSISEKAGMMNGDEILAVNGNRIDQEELDKLLEGLKDGETAVFTVFRNDKLKEFKLKIGSKKTANYFLVKKDNPTDLQRKIYEAWLMTPWEH